MADCNSLQQQFTFLQLVVRYQPFYSWLHPFPNGFNLTIGFTNFWMSAVGMKSTIIGSALIKNGFNLNNMVPPKMYWNGSSALGFFPITTFPHASVKLLILGFNSHFVVHKHTLVSTGFFGRGGGGGGIVLHNLINHHKEVIDIPK